MVKSYPAVDTCRLRCCWPCSRLWQLQQTCPCLFAFFAVHWQQHSFAGLCPPYSPRQPWQLYSCNSSRWYNLCCCCISFSCYLSFWFSAEQLPHTCISAWRKCCVGAGQWGCSISRSRMAICATGSASSCQCIEATKTILIHQSGIALQMWINV